MKTHMRMNYGCDKRLPIVKDTVKVCSKYFDTMKILVTSGTKDYEAVKELEKVVPNLKVDKFPVYYYGDFEPILRNLFWDVPEDEWIHILDSDERPSPAFLTSIQDIIDDAINNNISSCRIPTAFHSMKKGEYSSLEDYIPLLNKTKTSAYSELSLFKFNRRMVYFISSYGGCHTMPYRKDSVNKMYLKPTFHFKNIVPNNWNQSVSLHGFFNPGIHSGVKERESMLNSPEFCEFNKLKVKFKCYTSSQFIDELLSNPPLKEEAKLLFTTFKNSQITTFHYMYAWAMESGLTPCVNEIPDYCGRECCKYEDIQL